MSASFNAALKQAELAAKSKGTQGDVEQLKAFEDLAAKHEQRLKLLDERAKKMKSGSILDTTQGDKLALAWRTLDALGDFIISPAEAAIALNVYNLCRGLDSKSTAAQWAACNQAIANAPAQRAAAQAIYNSCWNSLEGVRPKWWRALRGAGCTLAYVARLA